MQTIHGVLLVAAVIGVSSVSTASFASNETSPLTSSPTLESASSIVDPASLGNDASNQADPAREANVIAKIGNLRKGIGNAIRKVTKGKIGRVPKSIKDKESGGRVHRPHKAHHMTIQ